LKFDAAWLQEPLFDVPAIQNAFWTLLWLIPEVAPELPPPLGSDPDAVEAVLPGLEPTTNWLCELLVWVRGSPDEVWVLLWVIDEAPFEIVCCSSIDVAEDEFAAIEMARNPAAIIVAIIRSLEAFTLMISTLKYH
jgi:hypothetical protein